MSAIAFRIRRASTSLTVVNMDIDGANIDLGYLNTKEVRELAETLRHAADDLDQRLVAIDAARAAIAKVKGDGQ